jgi:hypothetical protein
MSACVSIRQDSLGTRSSAYVSIRQHTSAYVSVRQHTSAYVRIRWELVRLCAEYLILVVEYLVCEALSY